MHWARDVGQERGAGEAVDVVEPELRGDAQALDQVGEDCWVVFEGDEGLFAWMRC